LKVERGKLKVEREKNGTLEEGKNPETTTTKPR
jgi:hypothetical protein